MSSKRKLFYALLIVGIILAIAIPVLASIIHDGNDGRSVVIYEIPEEDYKLNWQIHNTWVDDGPPDWTKYCDSSGSYIAEVTVVKKAPTSGHTFVIKCYESKRATPTTAPTRIP